MTGHDIQLLIITVCSILLLIFFIVSKLRLHPFVALLVVSVGAGLASGLGIDKLAKSIEEGAGSTLGNVGLTVALGVMLGKLLADSGASDRIASVILRGSTRRSLPWLMAAAAFIIGIPMFFEVGLIILLPLIFTVARKLEQHGGTKGSPYILVGVPVIAALATMHGMVPPHPGPLISVSAFHANLGLTMIYGFICAIPSIIIAGPVYAKFLAPRMTVRPDNDLLDQYTAEKEVKEEAQPIPFFTALVAILLPVVMMLIRALAGIFLPEKSMANKVAEFIGEPVIAMLIGLIAAMILLGYARGADTKKLRDSFGSSLKSIAGILLIIAGGGAFGQVLKDSNVGDAIVHLTAGLHFSAIALGWLVAALLSVSTGSATVGIVGSTSLLAPLAADPSINTALLVVAIGSGSLFFNYANHAGFWLVKESFGMSMGETFKTITIVQSIVGLVGLAMALLLNLIVG
ncbi:GntP family permease [Scopulibacillus cellulosilyticus]|uniref:GntP family permease n=1 Tax=Scopulibacillus cellulosilyticus TaxID=2665665 RepID=A0ABW2PZU2_9BACL